MTQPIQVLVVEDSLTIRKYIVEVLAAAPGIEVVGEAADGKAAIELCRRLEPDAVTMDMVLPIMSGLAATEYIMAHFPTPILIVSASTNRVELFKTYDALAAGAVDVLDKPRGSGEKPDWEGRLVESVRMVARIRVIRHPRGRLGRWGQIAGAPPQVATSAFSRRARVVAIGTSTGGPSAVLRILEMLPKSFSVPVLLVLHISDDFAGAMATWLDAQVDFEVRFAEDGEPLPPPGRRCVIMAPAGHHLEVARGRLKLSQAPERHSCRPSVDVLFESLARDMGASTIACLLTGMGRDGASGLLDIRNSGGLTLAQDEATSVVFGMPGEGVKLGAASMVLPLSAMAGAIDAAVTGGGDG